MYLNKRIKSSLQSGTKSILLIQFWIPFNAGVGLTGSPWGQVQDALLVSGSSLYVGWGFSGYSGTPVQNLIKVDITTGNLDTLFSQSTGPDS